MARTAALIALGAFVVHQLRYLAGYGDAAGSELARQGHGYLTGALPILAAFLLSAVAAGLLRAALGRHSVPPAGRPGRRRDTVGRRAGLFAAAIIVVFCSQESLEGALSAGHPGGLGAVLAQGGWVALPLALLVGLLCALLDRGLSRLEVAITWGGATSPPGRRAADAALPRPALLVPLSAAPLAFGIARRPPPARC
jgi:hypothetical protein